MESKNILQIIILAVLLIIAGWYCLKHGRDQALTLAAGLFIWSLIVALLRRIGVEV